MVGMNESSTHACFFCRVSSKYSNLESVTYSQREIYSVVSSLREAQTLTLTGISRHAHLLPVVRQKLERIL